MIKLSLACFVLFFGSLVIADDVPVFIWGPFNHYTPAIAIKSYNADEFIDILSEQITPNTFTLIVTEDTLMTEDLSLCRTSLGKTCYQGLQQIQTKLYLTSVEDPVQVLQDVSGEDKNEISLLSNGELSEPLNPKGGKYVFVNFVDDITDETKSEKLTRHDQSIMNIYNELSSQGVELLVIYTGKASEVQKRVVRQAPKQAAADTNVTTAAPPAASTTVQPRQETVGTFWQRERVLIYYTGLDLTVGTGAATPINITTVNATTTGINVEVEMSDDTNNLIFVITEEAGYWWINQITWNNETLTSDTRVAAVETFSFHCSPSIQLATANRNTKIHIRGLQIQPLFGVVAGQPFNSFGDAWDCVGFVSPGIVGGLFVVIMLLFILSIGISWMMDINTMDRFDDPKGKTITINVNE